MNIIEIIEKKRDNKELTKQEIEFFIKGYTNGDIADYQVASLIMAIFLNSMTKHEITDLATAMANSGEILDLNNLNKIIVDKHSTGGVGDKVSLILLPLVASLGVTVAKMSGRGLGFTGGTVDKLESIPGYRTDIPIDEFISNVEKIGISMISQTLNLAPADKKIYALRDSIACVESIPLIASSIMSKKIASGSNKIVLDVTVGNGAFMKNLNDAKKLAREMIDIGKLTGRETICILTSMDEPLGYAVGNNLEVIEAVKFLKGEELPEDEKKVVFELGAYMIKLAGLGDNLEENKQKMLDNIKNGNAYKKFLEMIQNQGGDISYIQYTEKFEKSKNISSVIADKTGYISEINAEQIGRLCCELGAGRVKKEDKIDYTAGIVLNKKVGDKVQKNELLATVYSNKEDKIELACEKVKNIIKIQDDMLECKDVILEIYI